MTTTDPLLPILADLARANIKIRLVDNDELEISAPRGALTAQLRERLVAHKPDLMRWLADAAPSDTSYDLPVVTPDPAAADEPFPLSDLQTSFLVGSAEGMDYHVRPHQYMEFDVDGLEVERFTAALNTGLLHQRDNLVILTEDMQLRRIPTFTPLRPRVHDFSGLSPEEAAKELLRLRQGMRRRQLPLDRWPSLDVQISLHGERSGRIHYNNNNFYADGVGTSRFLDHVFRLYRDPCYAAPPLEVSFRDCILTLDEISKSELGVQSQRYWLERIPDWPDAPAVPMAPRTDTVGRSELSRRELVLSPEGWSKLKQQGRMRGLTDSNVMYAAYAEVLSRFSGSRHFLLNNMVTHRMPIHPQIGEILGNFAALYPLEVDWRTDENFTARAQRLRSRILEDVRHLHWSGVNVLQALNQYRRTPGRAVCPFVISSGLFMGIFQRPSFSTLETPQVLVDCQFWKQDQGACWIVWDVIEGAFPEGLMDAMFAAFRELILGLVEDDAMWERTGFDLVPADQLRQRMELNCSIRPLPDGLLHDALAQRAEEMRGKVAVRTSMETLTYGDLRERSDRIAGALQAAGAQPGAPVPIILPRGWEQVVGVFGILTAGGAYVPVDPDWPTDRITQLLSRTDAEHVVTSESLRERISGLASVKVHTIEEPGDYAPAPVAGRKPDDLAYVIYTSGSTGAPKGAALDHRGPLNTIADINERFGITADDVVFGISSLYFDLSVYDVFGTVLAGATLVLPASADGDNPAAWLAVVRTQGVTVWNSVPALMQLLVEEAEEAGVDLLSLRVVLLSGDWIPVDLPDRIRKVAPNATVISLGGATEASIWSIYYSIDKVDPVWASFPYGRPLANQSWHVLDSSGADMPTWVPGELHIGGNGLAKGYWNDPERTDAAFVMHPRTGQRLYRTGDFGRYLPSGDIELLGRVDFQVKLQGFRVELGEIEYVLGAHPAVRRALVVVRDTPSGRQLAAFAVTADDQAVDTASLREYLAACLPRYMVPATITTVEHLPLTANGKVDRRALQKVTPAEAVAQLDHVPPRTSLEETVAAIWSEVLDIDRVGVHDDFFELGGQSFAGLRMISQIARRLGRRLSLGTLLTGRTVAALCEHLEKADTWSPLVYLRRSGSDVTAFMAHAAGGSVMCYRSLAQAVDVNWFALQAPGPDIGRKVPGSVAEFAAEYIEEIRRVQPAGPYVLGGWSSGAVIAAEVARRLELLGDQVRLLAVLDSPVPHQAPEVDAVTLLLWFLEDLNLGFRATDVTDEERAELQGLCSCQQLPAGLALVSRHTGCEVDFDDVHLAHAFEVFTGVVTATREYEPSVLGADIVVVRAAVGRVSEFADHPHAADDDWGWRTVTTGRVTSARVAGTHYTLLSDRHVAGVVGVLAQHMQAVALAE